MALRYLGYKLDQQVRKGWLGPPEVRMPSSTGLKG